MSGIGHKLDLDQDRSAILSVAFKLRTRRRFAAPTASIRRSCHEHIVAKLDCRAGRRCDAVVCRAVSCGNDCVAADAEKRGGASCRDRAIPRGWRGGRYGGVAVGLGIAGALIGGAIVGAAQPYGYGYAPGYYGYAPGYYGPAYVAPAPYVSGDATAYCAQRFRSYDPYSGTYLGYDGFRHPCP